MGFRGRCVSIVLAALGLVAGCAPSSQTVKLQPEPQVQEAAEPEEGRLALRVIDRRSRAIYGYRDEGSGAILEGDRELADALRQGLVEAWADLGVQVEAWQPDAERRLEVVIQDVRYRRAGFFLSRRARLSAEWQISGSIDGSSYSSEVRLSTEERGLLGPSESKNAEMVNRILARGIERIATQPDLLDLLDVEDEG